MTGLTPKQEEILLYIKDSIVKRGYPPSVREICKAVSLRSTSSVHAHLESLEKKGLIRKDPAKPRTIEINVPILGNVAAGEPIFAEQNIQSYFPLPSGYLPHSDTFMLKVKGDSMIDVGIYNNDDIIVSKQNYANNGDIVVALLEDSATVKRFYKEDGHYRLQPENRTMEPIIVDSVVILGKVIGLLRMM